MPLTTPKNHFENSENLASESADKMLLVESTNKNSENITSSPCILKNQMMDWLNEQKKTEDPLEFSFLLKSIYTNCLGPEELQGEIITWCHQYLCEK